jgi:hypothetical protein
MMHGAGTKCARPYVSDIAGHGGSSFSLPALSQVGSGCTNQQQQQ